MPIIGIPDVLKWGRGARIKFEHDVDTTTALSIVRVYNPWQRPITVERVWFRDTDGDLPAEPIEETPSLPAELTDGQKVLVTFDYRDLDPNWTHRGEVTRVRVKLGNAEVISKRISRTRRKQLGL